MSLKHITDDLIADLAGLTFEAPVTHVYNPLLYARAAWDQYCDKFGQGPREILMLGMNPGPPGLSNPYELAHRPAGGETAERGHSPRSRCHASHTSLAWGCWAMEGNAT